MDRRQLFRLIVALAIIAVVTVLIITGDVASEIGLGIIVAIGVAFGVIERGIRARQ